MTVTVPTGEEFATLADRVTALEKASAPTPTPAPTPVPAPAPTPTGRLAARAHDLSRMVALNTHIDFGPTGIIPQYGNFPKLIENINFIWQNAGVPPLLRDSPSNPADATWWPQIATPTGAKFIAFIGETTPDQYQGFVDRALALGSLIAYLDGPNEEDSASANGLTAGVDQVTSLNNAAAYMPKLWQIARDHGLPVINMSYGQGWGTSYDPAFQHGYYGINGDLSAYCTYANAHTYPQNGDPPAAGIAQVAAAARRAAASRPVAHTEIGYGIGSGGALVPQDAQAKYGLAGLMDAFNAGAVLYAWYAAYDDLSGPWGMFNPDYSPRPLATLLRNFLGIIADTGPAAATFVTGRLPFTVDGCASALLERNDGTFLLVLWHEQKITAGQNPKLTCNVALGVFAKSIAVFDPLVGTSAVQSGSGALISVDVPVHPIVVQISGT